MEVFAVMLFGFISYMFPALVAESKGHSKKTSIAIINVFFGWTVFGWAICLAWAFSE